MQTRRCGFTRSKRSRWEQELRCITPRCWLISWSSTTQSGFILYTSLMYRCWKMWRFGHGELILVHFSHTALMVERLSEPLDHVLVINPQTLIVFKCKSSEGPRHTSEQTDLSYTDASPPSPLLLITQPSFTAPRLLLLLNRAELIVLFTTSLCRPSSLTAFYLFIY